MGFRTTFYLGEDVKDEREKDSFLLLTSSSSLQCRRRVVCYTGTCYTRVIIRERRVGRAAHTRNVRSLNMHAVATSK